MQRRCFLGFVGSTIAWPVTAFAQQSSAKVWRIAWLYPGSIDTPSDRALLDVCHSELRKLGYVEGKNLVIDSRGAEGQFERLFPLVAELVALGPDVIVAVTTPAIAAAQRATSTIPIVMAPATDPVGSGFIKSLAHPGGNITGVANMYGDAIGKAVELLHSIAPAAKRIAVLGSSNTAHPQQYELAEVALKTLGLAAVRVKAPTAADLEQAFDTMKQENCDALFVLADATRPAIVSLTAKLKIPAIYQFGGFVDLGGLASYGASLAPMFRQTAVYVDKIFKGVNPAELPVEQPIVFELALNLKTAAVLGLSIPAAVLARADKVIE